MDVGIGRRDIKIAEQDEFIVVLQQFAGEDIQSRQPVEFVGVLVRANLGTVRHVQVQYANVVNQGAQYAFLRIFKAGQAGMQQLNRFPAHDGNAVIGFLPGKNHLVTQFVKSMGREILILGLGFLQGKHVRFMGVQPL